MGVPIALFGRPLQVRQHGSHRLRVVAVEVQRDQAILRQAERVARLRAGPAPAQFRRSITNVVSQLREPRVAAGNAPLRCLVKPETRRVEPSRPELSDRDILRSLAVARARRGFPPEPREIRVTHLARRRQPASYMASTCLMPCGFFHAPKRLPLVPAKRRE